MAMYNVWEVIDGDMWSESFSDAQKAIDHAIFLAEEPCHRKRDVMVIISDDPENPNGDVIWDMQEWRLARKEHINRCRQHELDGGVCQGGWVQNYYKYV